MTTMTVDQHMAAADEAAGEAITHRLVAARLMSEARHELGDRFPAWAQTYLVKDAVRELEGC